MRLIQGIELAQLVKHHVQDSVLPNYTELDIRLGSNYWTEKDRSSSQRVHVMKPEDWNSHLTKKQIPEHGVTLAAGRFMLAETYEYFDMPENVEGILSLRSWAAKSGLEQSSSLTLKPGWHGILILELFNSLAWYDLLMTPGLSIAQIQFFDIGD